jgi:rubredoxin
MGQTFCPQCSCDAASVLSFATNDGGFAAAVQCHVCGFETIAAEGFQDERTAREAATHAWLELTEPLPLAPRT